MQYTSVFFLGAGGIGMSALERYFKQLGCFVAGYDRTRSNLTDALGEEGIALHFEDDPELIPAACRDPKNTLVVYTPAIPADNRELQWLREGGFEIQKRAQVLGTLTKTKKGLCVAGTHGKTSTSAITAHLLHESTVDCNAFLGGITKNYGTNYILAPESDFCCHRGRRVRSLFPPLASLCHSDHLGRCRPLGHLRHRRGLSRKFFALHLAHSTGRSAHHTPRFALHRAFATGSAPL